MERKLRLPSNNIVTDQNQIDAFLNQRRKIDRQKSTLPPPQVLKDIDFSQAKLERVEREIVGTLELNVKSEIGSFNNVLYQAPDLRVELNPQEGDELWLPRTVLSFKLTSGTKELIIETQFDKTEGEYWDNYRNKAKVEELVKKNLLEALRSKKWKQDAFGVWFVAK